MKEEKAKNTPETYENEDIEIDVHEVGEDSTKYGEFISTYFAWIPLSKQKQKAKQMEKMTQKGNQKTNKIKQENN